MVVSITTVSIATAVIAELTWTETHRVLCYLSKVWDEPLIFHLMHTKISMKIIILMLYYIKYDLCIVYSVYTITNRNTNYHKISK